jgi:hypothetical protein
MALTDADKLMETETTIRWDALDSIATMWTASISVRREWTANGFPIVESGRGWASTVPSNRISYKTLKIASK